MTLSASSDSSAATWSPVRVARRSTPAGCTERASISAPSLAPAILASSDRRTPVQLWVVDQPSTQAIGRSAVTCSIPSSWSRVSTVRFWPTSQAWTGVRLSELARAAGAAEGAEVQVVSVQPAGVLRQATLTGDQAAAESSLLALKVNGADLSLDHGFPARIIVPALPGVHNTKWVGKLVFAA